MVAIAQRWAELGGKAFGNKWVTIHLGYIPSSVSGRTSMSSGYA